MDDNNNLRNLEENEVEDSDEMPPRRRRRRPLMIIAVIVLIIVLVGGGLAIVHAVSGGAIGVAPTPTATLLPGENLFYITTDPCSTLQAILLNNSGPSNPYYSITVNGQPQNLNWQGYYSGHNLAQGCLMDAVIQPGNNTPIAANAPQATILYRFGVLLAANSLSHLWWPNLPVVNSYEQGIANQLGTSG